MYEIFSNNNLLLLISPRLGELKKNNKDLIHFDNKKLQNALVECQNRSNETIVVTGDPEKLYNDLLKHFTLLEAAGGVVLNKDGEILFIMRHGIWDLPKGKIEINEDPPGAAVREVTEECGISHPEIKRFLNNTYHTYYLNKKPVLKKTYWYLMLYTGNETLQPQIEEGISDVKWFPSNALKPVLENTYPNIHRLVLSYLGQSK